ncbi:disease resistance protein RGA2-like isoform X2 [Triticum dicoccoides]|uniref:disease resistance protein RGA2-like isoform X2 n=1 Tax=Triticum dicoccoides TaxID=85692 RepID=UPI000E788699|nr:disease resistance protein RGA2-like isoform X2 [Triticum dicoccoides]
MDVLVSNLKWEVGKARAHLADGSLEAWAAGNNLGPNIMALSEQLLRAKRALEAASGNQRSPQLNRLLEMLREPAQNADYLLEELDYFRIHDELHAKGRALDAPHTFNSKAVGKLGEVQGARQHVSCCAWPRAQRIRPNSSTTAANRDGEEELLLHASLAGNASYCIMQDTTDNRVINSSQSIEPAFCGRDHIMNTIIHDMTNGKYRGKGLSVLPTVGPGGIGKTSLVHQIYHSQQVQNHFQVTVWIHVSTRLNLKLLEEIKESIPAVKGEKEDTPGELIEQRLKYKRFLLVLDDIWLVSDDAWKRLLSALDQSEEKGSMVLVTTRFPSIARMVGTADHSIILKGLQTEEFRKLFFAFVFGDELCERDHSFLLETGCMIMDKLKGYPLTARIVGRLLSKQLSLHHWRGILESGKWTEQMNEDDIMPALRISYGHLPFHLQQCFSCSALFPKYFCFSSSQLINLWVGLDILQPDSRNQTFEDIGMRNLNDLVTHGFFREEVANGRPCYVMHDLVHELALKVASHDCLILRHSNMRYVDIQPSIRHLSIIIDDDDDDDTMCDDDFESQRTKLITSLKVKQLHTFMLFGETDENFVNVLGDLLRKANALRVLHLVTTPSSVESMLRNFSAHVHLRYLSLGTKDRGLLHRFLCLGTEYESQMHLPLAISRFYNLRILDLGSWYGRCDMVWDMSNLTKLCCFYTQKDELHSAICNVGKHKLLEELKVFRVNKESEGFEPKQLEHLTEVTELGIYNLENVHTKEEAAEAKLIEKNYLEKLTLDWDSQRSDAEPDVEAVVLESLEPHTYLRELCIRGHGGPSCPTWLGDELVVKALQSLCLVGVSWKVLPSVGKMWCLRKLVLKHIATVKEFVIEQSFCGLIWFELVGLESFEKWVPAQDAHHMFPLLQVLIIRDCPKLLELPFSNHIVYPPEQRWNIDWFPKLQELEIDNCPELLPLHPIPWTETLYSVSIRGVMLLEKLVYSNSSHGVRLDIAGKDDLHSLDQVLAFNNLTELEELSLMKCPPLELKHLVMLNSLKTLLAESSQALVEPLGGQDDTEWQLPIEHIEVQELCGNSGKEFTEFLTHLPGLSKLEIVECGKITHLAVKVDRQQVTLAASEVEKDDTPPPPAEQEKEEDGVLLFPVHLSSTLRELVISHCPELVLLPDGEEGLQALRCLQRLKLKETPKFLSAYLPSCRFFPSSLQFLELNGVEGMETVEPLSNLISLTILELRNCGHDLRCKGLGPLLTIGIGGQLSALIVYGSPRFFAGWDPNPREVLQGEGEQQLQLVSPLRSSKLQKLWTDDVAGLLSTPICSLLSSSLTQLQLSGAKEMESFSNEQEHALHLLASLLELEFFGFDKLQRLPAGLHKLTYLKELQVGRCPSVRSLPKNGLPKSLQKLHVSACDSEELKQHCRELVGTIPKIKL